MDNENTVEAIRRAEEGLSRHLTWISRYDGRSAFLVGIELAMLGHFMTIIPSNASMGSILSWLIVFFLVLKVIAFALVFRGNFPNVNAKNHSLVFFQTISAREVDGFIREVKEASPEEYLDDLLRQIHINASILAKKSQSLKTGMIVMLISVIPWISIIYLTGTT